MILKSPGVYAREIDEFPFYFNKSFLIVDRAEVGNEPWATILCNDTVAKWIRTMPKSSTWYEHPPDNRLLLPNSFDINEKLLIQIGLKWS